MIAPRTRTGLRAFVSLVRAELNDVAGMAAALACLPPLLVWSLDWVEKERIVGTAVFDMLLPGLLFFFWVPISATLVAGSLGDRLDFRLLSPPGSGVRFGSKIIAAVILGSLFVPWALYCLDPFYRVQDTGSSGLAWASAGTLNGLESPNALLLLGVSISVGFAAWVAAYVRRGFHATLLLAGLGFVACGFLRAESLANRWEKSGLASPIEVFGRGGILGLAIGLLGLTLMGAYMAWRPHRASTRSNLRAWGMGLIPLGLASLAVSGPVANRLTQWRELRMDDPDIELMSVGVDPGLNIAVLWHRARDLRRGSSIWLERPGFLNLDDGSWAAPIELSGELDPMGWDPHGDYWVRGKSWGERSKWVARINPRNPSEFERFDYDESSPPWGAEEPEARPGHSEHAPLKLLRVEPGTEETESARWSFRRSESAEVYPWPGLGWGRGSEGLGFAVGLVEGRSLEVLTAPFDAPRCLLGPEDVEGACDPTLLGGDRWLAVTSLDRSADSSAHHGRVYVFDRWTDWGRVGEWEHSTMVPELLGGDPSKDVLFLPGEFVTRCVDLGSGRTIVLEGLELGPGEFREWDRTRGAWLLSEGRVLIATPRRVVVFREDGSMERVLLDLDALQGRGDSNRE